MKTFLFLFGITCGISLTAQTQTPSTYTSSYNAEVRIKETTAPSGLLRSAPAPVVSAWLSDGQIDLTFLQDLGTVSISVTNAQETVYTATTTAADGSEWTVSVTDWPAGDYTIEIVRSNGQTLTGDFEL